jgi:hypothetical protein
VLGTAARERYALKSEVMPVRRIGLALLVLTVVAAAAAGWWWRRTLPAPAAGKNAPAAAVPAAQAVPIADLVLQLNGGTEAYVGRGTSVFFTVTLTGTSPEPAFRVGRQGTPWSANLRFETPDGKPVAIRIEQLGPPFTSRFADDPRVAAPPTPDGDEAIVDATRVHQVEFGVSPDEAARAAGTHALRAVLPIEGNARGPTRLVSNAVTLAIDDGTAAAQQAPGAEKLQLEAAARFYLRARRWDDAHRVARGLVERADADTTAFTLFADALDGLGRYDEALAAYQEAIAALPADVDESPDYLIARMDAVLRRLEAARGGKESAK